MSTRTICENCEHDFADHNFSTPSGYQHQCLRNYCVCPDWKPKQIKSAPKPPRNLRSDGLPTHEQWKDVRSVLTKMVGWFPHVDNTPDKYGTQTQGALVQKARRLLQETAPKNEAPLPAPVPLPEDV